MRLINTTTYTVHEFPGDSAGDYAILSHTWGEAECTLQDMSDPGVERRKGYKKIKFCCEQAVKEGLRWAWVDTCCIDKTSTAELSEAINSMFRWYRNAAVCYAYLADVTDQDDFDGFAYSRWFSRGWTLQELIAPRIMRFYSAEWTLVGFKSQLVDTLHEITGVDASVLSSGDFSRVCVAKRMSWAANRDTTRVEDQAYSLMGLFDVNMPLIYGEGNKAFLRLQQEIMRVSDDQSLFAWGAPEVFHDMHTFLMSLIRQMRGLFAESPADYRTDHEILETSIQEDSPPPVIHGNGVRIQYPVCKTGEFEFILLACTTRDAPRGYIAIPVKTWGDSCYARCGHLVLVFPEHWTKAQSKLLVMKEPPVGPKGPPPGSFQIVRVPNTKRARKEDHFVLKEVYCLPYAKYNPLDHSIVCSPRHAGPQAALFFTANTVLDRKRESVIGQFPIRSFAVVLSYSKVYPWISFVPILRDTHADEDFHEIIRVYTEMARCCMTESQLKDRLCRNDLGSYFVMKRRFDQLLSSWVEQYQRSRALVRNLEISVYLNQDNINLVDDTVFVSIDIYEVTSGLVPKTMGTSFIHSKDWITKEESKRERTGNYYPNWLEIEKLEWFIDRVPSKQCN